MESSGKQPGWSVINTNYGNIQTVRYNLMVHFILIFATISILIINISTVYDYYMVASVLNTNVIKAF